MTGDGRVTDDLAAQEGKMDVKEFARRAEISVSLAYVILGEEGRVPGVRRIGQKGKRGKYIITEEGLAQFLKQCEVQQEATERA